MQEVDDECSRVWPTIREEEEQECGASVALMSSRFLSLYYHMSQRLQS